jgi:hypothetical protein
MISKSVVHFQDDISQLTMDPELSQPGLSLETLQLGYYGQSGGMATGCAKYENVHHFWMMFLLSKALEYQIS